MMYLCSATTRYQIRRASVKKTPRQSARSEGLPTTQVRRQISFVITYLISSTWTTITSVARPLTLANLETAASSLAVIILCRMTNKPPTVWNSKGVFDGRLVTNLAVDQTELVYRQKQETRHAQQSLPLQLPARCTDCGKPWTDTHTHTTRFAFKLLQLLDMCWWTRCAFLKMWVESSRVSQHFHRPRKNPKWS